MILWKHQQDAVQRYKDAEFFGLLFPCGCGKTLTAIAIAEAKKKPVIIIAPNALCAQWEEEIKTKGEEEWQTLVCTSRTRKTQEFQRRLTALKAKN